MKIFNPQGTDNKSDRRLWGSEPTGLINLSDVKYNWARVIYKQMRGQFWIPEEVSLVTDTADYRRLTNAEREAFHRVLSNLSYLDSVQCRNIDYLSNPITAPELIPCFNEQKSQESLHVESYQYIIESVIPPDVDIYDYWRQDRHLLTRNQYVASIFQNYIDDPTDENYFYSLVADYILEGVYFFNGFIFFHVLKFRQLMPGCNDMIELIKKDEQLHVRLYQKLVQEAMTYFTYDVNKIYQMVDGAVQQEIDLYNAIIGNNIIGLCPAYTSSYTKYLGNLRLKGIGLKPIYPESESRNPYEHLEKASSAFGDTKEDFFSTNITSYLKAESDSLNWDDY